MGVMLCFIYGVLSAASEVL